MYRCLMMDSGTRMPSGSCGGLHDPTYQSHGPASWGHLIGDKWSVVDVLEGAGIARSGAERVNPPRAATGPGSQLWGT